MRLAVIDPVYSATPGPVYKAMSKLAYDVGRKGGEFWHEITWLSSNVTLSRFVLARWAVQTGADRILMHDDDVLFSTEDVEALYAIDADIVAGGYVKREPGANAVVGCAKEGGEERGLLLEMSMVGLGFCLVRREVLADLVERNGPDLFAFKYEPELQSVGDDSISFSRCAIAGGYKLWLHQGIVNLGHIGPHTHRLT